MTNGQWSPALGSPASTAASTDARPHIHIPVSGPGSIMDGSGWQGGDAGAALGAILFNLIMGDKPTPKELATAASGFHGIGSSSGGGKDGGNGNPPQSGGGGNNGGPSQPGDYLAGKGPKQVTPGTRTLEGVYVNDKGRVEPWKAYYDEYGRQIGRTDYNAGNKAQGIPDTHYHKYAPDTKIPSPFDYNRKPSIDPTQPNQYNNMRPVLDHVPGEFPVTGLTPVKPGQLPGTPILKPGQIPGATPLQLQPQAVAEGRVVVAAAKVLVEVSL